MYDTDGLGAMTTALYKVEGAGNDFVLALGDWAARLAEDRELVRRMCHRRLGIGADGVLLLVVKGLDRVLLAHRNADGSTAAFCGNGTRCAARAAVELAGCRPELVVETTWAPIAATVREMSVSLDLPAPREAPRPVTVRVEDRALEAWHIEVGVPHLVVPVRDPNALDLGAVAPPLRRHPALCPDGANVDFVAADDEGPAVIRTWERGVEGETLSCGSGIVAAALVVMSRHGTAAAHLRPMSGDVLRVEALGEPPLCPLRFTGPARIVAEIRPSEELVRGDSPASGRI